MKGAHLQFPNTSDSDSVAYSFEKHSNDKNNNNNNNKTTAATNTKIQPIAIDKHLKTAILGRISIQINSRKTTNNSNQQHQEQHWQQQATLATSSSIN